MSLQALVDRLHHPLPQRNPFVIDLLAELAHGMEPFPGHTRGPLQPRLRLDQLRPLPVQFQDAPAPLARILCAVIGRGIQQLNRLANAIGKLHHAREKLRPAAITLGTILPVNLQQIGSGCVDIVYSIPPCFQRIHNEIPRFIGTPTGDTALARLFIHDPAWDIFFLQAQVVITGAVVAPRQAAAGHIPHMHRGFTGETPALHPSRRERLRLLF